MNETNNQVVISLLDNVKRILRSEGVFSTKSELYLRMVSFEDEFYNVKNPPKSEQGDSKNSSQAVQQTQPEKCPVCENGTRYVPFGTSDGIKCKWCNGTGIQQAGA